MSELRHRASKTQEGASKPTQQVVLASSNKKVENRSAQQSRGLCSCLFICILFTVGFLLVAVFTLLTGVFMWKGEGPPFPNRSTKAKVQPGKLEIVAELPSPPGNLAVSASGRLIFSFHDFAPDPPAKICEWDFAQKTYQPFPNEAWQNAPGENGDYFRAVLSVRIDKQNRFWALDHATMGIAGTPTIFVFDLNKKSTPLLWKYELPPDVCGWGCFLNDFQVSPDGLWVYITNAALIGDPSLIVYDVEHGTSRRVLSGSSMVSSEGYLTTINGRALNLFHVLNFQAEVDSIGLDHRGEWLYFAATNALKLYRVRTEDLTNSDITDSELEDEVEAFADKTVSDGLAVDRQGNIYVTDFEHFGISVIDQRRNVLTHVTDPKLLRWPDGLSFGPDGWLYISCSDLIDIVNHKNYFGSTESFRENYGPFHILRIQTD